ncbi:MAG: TAXI family TRAP transporter solute-binding subunit [Candidatus Competibacterales bacterium]
MRTLFTAGLGLLLVATTATQTQAAEETFITIGTGGQTGVYYVVGQSICRLVNRNTSEHGIRCTAPSTGGSIANLNALRAGEQTMGVAQSDWQYHAFNGTSRFEEQGPMENLRAVFSVHKEPFTVVARADAGIESFMDLKDKRVNVGNPGSGQRGTMEVVMEAMGLTMDDFALASELKAAEQAQALGDNKIDAFIYQVGHPNGSILEATSTADGSLVSVEGDPIQELIDNNSFYSAATIPGGLYQGNDEDIATFGVGATFVTTAEVPDEVIYQVVKAVFENFDRFKRLHPAFENLDKTQMVKDGLTAPLHPGAERYYREAGLL